MASSSSWEDRYLHAFDEGAEFGALINIGKTAAARARALGEDDLADDLVDETKALQAAMDDLQDKFIDLDDIEKEHEGEGDGA